MGPQIEIGEVFGRLKKILKADQARGTSVIAHRQPGRISEIELSHQKSALPPSILKLVSLVKATPWPHIRLYQETVFDPKSIGVATQV